MLSTIQRLLEVLGRCPVCGRIPRRWYSYGKMKYPLLTIQDKKLAGKIAETMQRNSENKGGILIENCPGGTTLTEAFMQAGFSKVIVTAPEHNVPEATSEKSEVHHVQQGSMFSRHNLKLASRVEELFTDKLPHRFWSDAPVATVFGIVPHKMDMDLIYFLIGKMSFLSGFYGAGRVEWFVFVSPAKARALLCGNGEGPKRFYSASAAVVNVLYDIKHCLTVSASDFSPKFRTGSFQKQIKVGDVLLTDDNVYLLKLVPRKDIHIGIPTQEIWPFYHFMKQILFRKNERLIPLMEKFIHGCGLKMIDMGFTMVDEVWQIKPVQYLHLFMDAILWSEYEDSFLQSHLKHKLTDTTVESVQVDMDITDHDMFTDTTDQINVNSKLEHKKRAIAHEHDIDLEVLHEHETLNENITKDLTQEIVDHLDIDTESEYIDLDITDKYTDKDVVEQINKDVT